MLDPALGWALSSQLPVPLKIGAAQLVTSPLELFPSLQTLLHVLGSRTFTSVQDASTAVIDYHGCEQISERVWPYDPRTSLQLQPLFAQTQAGHKESLASRSMSPLLALPAGGADSARTASLASPGNCRPGWSDVTHVFHAEKQRWCYASTAQDCQTV